MIRGPGTVGLDSSVSIEELVNTTLEALEYFGVYNISRYYTYHPATLNIDNDHDDVDAHNAHDDHDNNNHNQVRLESSPDKTVETTGYAGSILHLAVEANDENRSASCHDTNSDPAAASSSSSSSSRRTNAIKHPQLPEELILDRRVSMGVYSLFTRF
jgi:hypothetical protein